MQSMRISLYGQASLSLTMLTACNPLHAISQSRLKLCLIISCRVIELKSLSSTINIYIWSCLCSIIFWPKLSGLLIDFLLLSSFSSSTKNFGEGSSKSYFSFGFIGIFSSIDVVGLWSFTKTNWFDLLE